MQCPVRCTQLHTIEHLQPIAQRGLRQGLLQVLVAAATILQALGTFSCHQMRQRAQPARVGQHLLTFGQRLLTGQHHIGRLTGPYVAPGQQMRQRIKQCGVKRTLMVLNPPTPGLSGYGEKRVQTPPSQVKNDKHQGEQQQH